MAEQPFPDMPKYCINCIHKRERAVDSPDHWSRNIRCFHPKNITNEVSSVTGDELLYVNDTNIVRNSYCQGTWFEPRITYLDINKSEGLKNVSNKAATRLGIEDL